MSDNSSSVGQTQRESSDDCIDMCLLGDDGDYAIRPLSVAMRTHLAKKYGHRLSDEEPPPGSDADGNGKEDGLSPEE